MIHFSFFFTFGEREAQHAGHAGQSEQPQPQPPDFPVRRIFRTANRTAAAIRIRISQSQPFMSQAPNNVPTRRTKKAMIQAIAHCHRTTSPAHFPPSSLLIAAIAATHGV